jgi:hypothetical protein
VHNFSDEFYERWEHLLSDAEITEVPMRFIKEVSVTFDNDDQKIFDIAHMLASGHDIELIEETIEEFLEEHDDDIAVVDFHINIPALAEEVDAKTNKLLDSD